METQQVEYKKSFGKELIQTFFERISNRGRLTLKDNPENYPELQFPFVEMGGF